MSTDLDVRRVAWAREQAEDSLANYARLLLDWNAPDDQHTRLQIRSLAEHVIEEAFAERVYRAARAKGLVS